MAHMNKSILTTVENIRGILQTSSHIIRGCFFVGIPTNSLFVAVHNETWMPHPLHHFYHWLRQSVITCSKAVMKRGERGRLYILLQRSFRGNVADFDMKLLSTLCRQYVTRLSWWMSFDQRCAVAMALNFICGGNPAKNKGS